MCGAHATVRGFLGELVARSSPSPDIIVDMEAGLEHLSRGTGRHISQFVAILEPYYRSMETARRIADLASELGIGRVQAVSNKVRDDGDRRAISAFAASHNLPLIGEIPYDPRLVEAERSGTPPVDYDPEAEAVAAIRRLANAMRASLS